MSASVILTVLGEDRPGIVESLSRLLGEHEGNWTDSNMLNLDGQFAGILRAELPSHQIDAFINALPALENQGLRIQAKSSIGPSTRGSLAYQLELIGQDRPGILHQLTSALARHHISVEELTTEIQSASMSGEDLFMARASLLVPPEGDTEALKTDIEQLADELMVDIDLKQ